MRDRLKMLIAEANVEWLNKTYDHETSKTLAEYAADHLLANGVTSMPEKVYWYNMGGKLVEAKVHNEKFIAEIDGGLKYDIPHKEIGKTVFLTREEAEKALKEAKG